MLTFVFCATVAIAATRDCLTQRLYFSHCYISNSITWLFGLANIS
jgi:hypothetical protein